MAFFLLLIFIVSVLIFWLGNRAAKGESCDPGKVVKSLTHFYAWMVCIFLCWMLLRFIGPEKYGSPQIELEQLRRISHLGYYISPQEELVFTGSNEKVGFKHIALSENEEISLKPLWKDDPDSFTTDEWEMKYWVYHHPLRLDNECINFPDDWWFNSDDTLVITYGGKNRPGYYISIRWHSEISGFSIFKKLKNSYLFNQGTFKPDHEGIPQLNPEFTQDILLTEKVLKEGFSLYSLIKNSAIRKQLNIKIPDWWEITGRIKFIRKIKGNIQSPMGVHIDDILFDNPGNAQFNHLSFYRLTRYNNFKKLHPIERKLRYETISSGKKIFYGFGMKDILSLSLSDRTTETPFLGNIMEVKFTYPTSWPLPPLSPPDLQQDKPRDFIITSSSEYIALDGYLIPGDNTFHPIYAKANFNKHKDSLSILVNDGRSKEDFKVNDTIRLGNFKNGVLLSLSELKAAVSYTGRWSILILFLLTLFFSISIYKEGEIRPRLDLSWALIWGLTLTILGVRLILSYRVSLLPPLDADPQELINVFHKSLKTNILALGIVPLFLLMVRLTAVHWSDIKYILKELANKIIPSSKKKKPNAPVNLRNKFTIYLLLFVLIILLLGLLGTNESFIGRINIIAHILVILLIILFARRIWESDNRKERVIFFLTLIAAPILVGVVIRDFGFLVYEISLCICVIITCLCRVNRRGVIILGILMVIVLTLFLGLAPHIPGIPLLQESIHLGFPDNVFYRTVKFRGAEESILLSRGSDDVSMTMLLRNSHQIWQMLHYAAQGISEPQGYGQAPLSNRGMTYPTAMTDCVFSILVLSEHGKWSGIFLILIYILLGFVCLYGACSLPGEYKHRLIPLTAIGAFFAFNSIYMACANLGLSIFTGQNIPLLGLYSLSDLVQGTLLLSFAVFLMREDINSDCPNDTPGVSLAMSTFVILAFLIALPGFLFKMNQMADPKSPYHRDHNFSNELFETIKNHLPNPEDIRDSGKPLELKGEYLVRRPFGKLKTIEKIFMDQFNKRPDKFNPDGGLFYLEKRPIGRSGKSENVIRINRNYFVMRSPFGKTTLWRGKLLSSEEEKAPTLVALRYPCTVTLSETGHASSIHLDRHRRRQNIHTNRKVLIKARNIAFFEIIRQEDKLELTPKHNPGWSIYVDGQKLKTQLDESITLEPYNLIVVENKQRDKALRYNLIYLGLQSPVLAFVQWRNGKDQRIFPDGSYFPMASTLGKAADHMANYGIKKTMALNLTLDRPLHIALQKEINYYGGTHRNYRISENISDTKILAAAVMDSFSGKILALPSYPSFDPGEPEFEEIFQKLTPRSQGKILKNNNLKNHAIGSTIKPLIFSAVAVGFQGKMDPAELVIFHKIEPRSKHEITDTKCPHSSIGKIPFSKWDCRQPNYTESNSRQYLVHSKNYIEVFMGMLGMLLNKEDWDKILIPDSNEPDLKYHDILYSIDLYKVGESPFTLKDPYPAPRTTTMNNTVLFKGMKDLYDVGISESMQDILYSRGKIFLPFFFETEDDKQYNEERILKILKKNDFFDDIIPDVVNFRPKDFQYIREDLVSFFLGGASCRWNNIHIMEALTRIVTGFRVTARFEKSRNRLDKPASMPVPINDNSYWKNINLIEPMKEVGEEGTANVLKGIVSSPYRIVYKTGTMEEKFEKVESEMLFFTIGRWDEKRGGFVPGETLSCYLYMQDSKSMDDPIMKKFGFAKPIITRLLTYLQSIPKRENTEYSIFQYETKEPNRDETGKEWDIKGIEGFYTTMMEDETGSRSMITLDIERISTIYEDWNLKCVLSSHSDIKKLPGTLDLDKLAIYIKGFGIGKIGKNKDGDIILNFFINDREVQFVRRSN
jgi:hypothetical protein